MGGGGEEEEAGLRLGHKGFFYFVDTENLKTKIRPKHVGCRGFIPWPLLRDMDHSEPRVLVNGGASA